ncbi:fanconi-associated nuclease 1-like isoform X2 [Prorops nasuta]|uniref:fanconi-associated nuclease 1-like isoform X2 n=1 Tax=Prorops nasuta TaxID=863751 RepID=UPI0034CF3B51
MSQPRIDSFFVIKTKIRSDAESKKLQSLKSKPVTARNIFSSPTKSYGSQKEDTFKASSSSFKRSNGFSNESVCESPKKVTKFDLTLDEELSPVKSQSKKFVVKTPTPVKRLFSQKKTASYKLIFKSNEEDIIIKAIEQLNLAKQGSIPLNDYNLHEIYTFNNFKVEYAKLNTMATTEYKLEDVVIPSEFNSLHLFMMMVNVFSNPVNCGYFSEDELDIVFSMLTLPNTAKYLLTCLVKRKQSWKRISSLRIPHLTENLEPIFEHLESCSFCTFDISSENINTLFDLLLVNEIREICKLFKLNIKGNKETLISELIQFSLRKPLFLNVRSPKEILLSAIKTKLGRCVRLKPQIYCIISRVITLLVPCQDPSDDIGKLFFTLLKVQQGEIKFPKLPLLHYPIFSDKPHLLSYVEAKTALADIVSAIEQKHWKTVTNLGEVAYERFKLFVKFDSISLACSAIPSHVQFYMPGYIWGKVLSKSIIAFKKDRLTIHQAISSLQALIEQKYYMRNSKGQWYTELALIYMYHLKDLNETAVILKKAFEDESFLTIVDKVNLLQRMDQMIRRRTGITKDLQDELAAIRNSIMSTVPDNNNICNNHVQAIRMKGLANNKAIWRINKGDDKETYGSVESLAVHHYLNEGFTNGLHCEGALPVALFSILFWEDIYTHPVPGAFVSSYQTAPSDLYTSEFYNNRKDRIDMKIQILNNLELDAFSTLIETNFLEYSQYQCLIPKHLFQSSNHLKEIVMCLGKENVMAICNRMMHDFRQWMAGFPDLIIWNPSTFKYKIVEVKGPKDKLSTKQELWLNFLYEHGISVEICWVQENHTP